MGWFFTFLIVFFDEQNFLILMNYNLFYSSVSYTFGIISKNPLRNPRSWKTDAKNWLIRKDPDAGKDWRQEEKGMTEGEMVGWHHQLDGHEFEQLWEMVEDMEAWHTAVQGVAKSQTRLSNWAELNWWFL